MSSRLSVTLLASALLLAACDSGAGEGTQPEVGSENAASDTQTLTGEIDRGSAGETIPAFEFNDPAGNSLDLQALDGTPVLINLWATWCAPCVVEMPMLDNLAAEMGDDLRVLTISQDSRGAEKVEPFFAARNFANLEPWLDPENELAMNYGGGGALPLTILFDAQGKEVFRVAGGYHWDSEEAIALIKEALAE